MGADLDIGSVPAWLTGGHELHHVAPGNVARGHRAPHLRYLGDASIYEGHQDVWTQGYITRQYAKAACRGATNLKAFSEADHLEYDIR